MATTTKRDRPRREERLGFRVDGPTKALIERAAELDVGHLAHRPILRRDGENAPVQEPGVDHSVRSDHDGPPAPRRATVLGHRRAAKRSWRVPLAALRSRLPCNSETSRSRSAGTRSRWARIALRPAISASGRARKAVPSSLAVPSRVPERSMACSAGRARPVRGRARRGSP